MTLGRGALVSLLATAALLPAAIMTSSLIALAGDSAAERRSMERQAAVFRGIAPGQPVPPSPAARLRAMARESRGKSPTGPEPTPSALTMVYSALSRLPDQRLRILELRATPGTIAIEGQARSHGDAEAVASALQTRGSGPGLAVAPPKSSSTANGTVSFSLTASAIGAVPSGTRP